MNNRPLLTIYYLIYNHAAFIEEHLDDTANQIRQIGGEKEIEVVLSDNCSTDNSAEKIKNFLAKNADLNFVYSRNEKNVGVSKNILDCGVKSTGEFIIIMGDDFFAKGGLRSILQTIKENQNSDFILIKNSAYSDFEYIAKARVADFMRNIDKIGFVGNFILKKDFFFENFKKYDEALGNFYPHMILIMEKIAVAKITIDTRFVAINISNSWDYKRQTRKVFHLLIDGFEVGFAVKEFIDKKDYNFYIKKCSKTLYDSLRYLRWHQDRIDIALYVFKKLKVRKPKVVFGLFIYALPAPLFYLSRMIAMNLKYCSQCIKEMIDSRKMWNDKELIKSQNYVGKE